MKNEIKNIEYSWLGGHFLGNGDVGAVVWGNGDAVRIGLSKHDINDLRVGGNSKGTRWGSKYPEMRNRVINGERDFLDSIENVENLLQIPPAQLAAGCLTLEVGKGVPVVGYEQTLDMEKGEVIACSIPTNSGKGWCADFAEINIKTIVLADRNAVFVELSSRLEQKVLWNFAVNPNYDLPKPVFTKDDDDVLIMERSLPFSTSYSVAVDVPGEKHFTPLGMSGLISFGGKNDTASFLLSVVSNYDNPYVKAHAVKITRDIRLAGVSNLLINHYNWWNEFWKKSSVSYEDKSIENLWRMGVYLLGSSTRNDTSPPNLQGIWNQYDNPPWSADFHFNTNVQECHWLACISNHPELQEALVNKLTGDWYENLKLYTKDNFQSDGISIPLCTDWLGRPIGYMELDLAISLSAWMCWHLWQQWLYTKDVEMLKSKIYPFMKESAMFYFDILNRHDDGLYHIELTQSPEQTRQDLNGKNRISYGSDAVIDIAFIKTLMNSLINGADIVGESDDGFVEKCSDVLSNLPDYPTKDGILIDYDVCYFYTGDAPGQFKISHRHPSRLTPIYPCCEIGIHSSDETLEFGRKSFNEFRSYGSHGFSGWSMAWQSIIAARLGLKSEFEKQLREFMKLFLLSNGISCHNRLGKKGEILQIEAILGAAAAVNEALIQTSGGIVYLFPGVPDERSASFQSLRTENAFLVSADKKREQIMNVEVLSLIGCKFRLANPWNNHKVLITGDKILQLSGKTIAFDTNPNCVYKLSLIL